MSYLQRPRLHFFGQFETDVSTVNNLATNFDEGTFTPDDAKRTRDGSAGSWNPSGSGTFRLVGCNVTTAHLPGGADAAGDDPVLGMQLADSGARVPAKLVDLDPDQQAVSQIWGLFVRLMTASGDVAFAARFVVTPFTDMWPRKQNGGGSGAFSAFYQSQLRDVTWGAVADSSPFLRELRRAAGDGPLSIRFVTDRFDGNFTSPTFRLGRLAGSLGVAHAGEPQHFVRGRQLFSTAMGPPTNPAFPFAPKPAAFGNAVAIVDRDAGKVIVDLGNAMPTSGADFAIANIGPLELGTGTASAFTSLGSIAYGDAGWYANTAGVVEVPAGGRLTAEQMDALDDTPLVLLAANVVQAAEANGGMHVRADEFVLRLSPGDDVRLPLYATQFGRPLQTDVGCAFDNSALGQTGDPPVGDPPGALSFPATVTTDANGIGWLTFAATNPGNRRVYIDGQIYGVRPTLAVQNTAGGCYNSADFISILLWDEIAMPDEPTWYVHVRPILQQYANLYPVMRQVLDLDRYESVVAHKEMLELVFSLPVEDPNYMPVTRDLSVQKRKLLLKWLSAAGEPALGHEPPLGSVPPPAPAGPAAAVLAAGAAPSQLPAAAALESDGSKADFLRRTARFAGKDSSS